jgi:hypothetical protein
MLRPILKLLPVFIVELLASLCEAVVIGGVEYWTVFDNVLVRKL